MPTRILLVDDDPDYLEVMRVKLRDSGFNDIRIEEDPIKAASLVEKGEMFDIALIDRGMEGMDGIALLEFIKNTSPGTECIMVTAYNDVRMAVESLKKGAYDYLVKPVTREDLVFAINRSLERKRLLDILDIEKGKIVPELEHASAFRSLITQSPKMLRILKQAELHAGSNMPILITGESGTGKELLARAIHEASPRSKEPFTPINMAALSGNLFEAEFFGHTKGAFTGAEKDRSGFLKSANHGTLFLDEIGNLPLELQAKLLRVLQDGEFTMLGTSKRQKVDVRFITATNEDLDLLLARKKFRKDLYYRIRGGWLHLPPLRERKEDIPLLINSLLQVHCGQNGVCAVKPEVMELFMEYSFPGNVRELQSIILSALNLAQGKLISIHELPDGLRKLKYASRGRQKSDPGDTAPLADVEKAHILKIYTRTGKNKSKTARQLGIGLNTLRRKLLSYGFD